MWNGEAVKGPTVDINPLHAATVFGFPPAGSLSPSFCDPDTKNDAVTLPAPTVQGLSPNAGEIISRWLS